MPAWERDAPGEALARRLAQRIARLKDRFPHFRDYDPAEAVAGMRIAYHRGVRRVPNTRYEELMEAARREDEAHPGRLRPLIMKEIEVYDPADGIYICIDVIAPEELNRIQCAFAPDAEIGGYSVRVHVTGAETPSLREIRLGIRAILDEEKALHEQGDSP